MQTQELIWNWHRSGARDATFTDRVVTSGDGWHVSGLARDFGRTGCTTLTSLLAALWRYQGSAERCGRRWGFEQMHRAFFDGVIGIGLLLSHRPASSHR
jgi:hypothetical protein